MTYPATNFEEAVSNTITSSDQLHQIINGSTTDTVTTDSGEIPSVRKALTDNMYFVEAIPWAQGSNETVFNQLRTFTDNAVYWAPNATVSNPVPMGATPDGDSNWTLAPVSLTEEKIRQVSSEVANAGDSQLAGGKIFPVENRSAVIGEDLTGAYYIKLQGGDFSELTTFPLIKKDGSTGGISGKLSNVNLTTKPYSATIGSDDIYLPDIRFWHFPVAAFNIKSMWAIGDGVADDTSPIRKTLEMFRGALRTEGHSGLFGGTAFGGMITTGGNKGAWSDSREGFLSVYFPRGVYNMTDEANLYAGVKIFGDGSGAITGTTINQTNIDKPAFRVHPKNYGPNNEIWNTSNGINYFSDINIRNNKVKDDSFNASLCYFMSAQESTDFFNYSGDSKGGEVEHIDTVFNNVWFAFSANHPIITEKARLHAQIIDCTFDVTRGGIYSSPQNTKEIDLRIRGTQFFHCVRGALICDNNNKNKISMSSSKIAYCGNPLNSNALYRDAVRYSDLLGRFSANDCEIEGGLLEGNNFGGSVVVSSRRVKITSTTITNPWVNAGGGVRVNAELCTFDENTLVADRDNGQSNQRFLNITNPSMNGSIVNNTFHNGTTKTMEAFIYADNNHISPLRVGNSYVGLITNKVSPRISGNSSNALIEETRKIRYDTSPPTGGAWTKGDVVYNSDPAVGRAYGWICVISGSGGSAVWASLGDIV